MKATAEKLEKNTVVLEVEVEAEKFSEAVNQAYIKFSKRVNIPGFRKGKAPRVIMERYLNTEAVYDEAVEIALPEAYINAVENTGIEPVAQPEVEIIQVEDGKPLVFKATVVVKPEVKLGQYFGTEVEPLEIEVSEEDVQKDLERLQNRHARLTTVEEGAVEQGDMTVIDFEGKTDGVPFEGGKADDYTLEIGSGSFIPGFEDGVVGMAINETKDINVTFPENYTSEELSGKPAVFTVTVKSIKRKEILPLDDEFAKDISEFDTLEELRDDVRNKLNKAAEAQKQNHIRMQALSKAIASAEMDIPNEMVDTQVDEMVKNMAERMTVQGYTLDKYLSYTESNLEQLREKIRPDAAESVKENLVLDAIIKAENLEVSEEELDEEIKRMSKEMNQDPDMIRRFIEAQDQLDMIKMGMLRDRVVKLLAEKTVLTKAASDDTKES